jgi:predicted DNA-binding transcriptional regulator AlpA
MGENLTQPEIAARYGVSEATIRLYRRQPQWPAPVGKRGRSQEYDAAEVDTAMRALSRAPIPNGDPDELLDARQAAAEADITPSALYADASRGRWPEPDDEQHGAKRWKRSTIVAHMAGRRRYARGSSLKADAGRGGPTSTGAQPLPSGNVTPPQRQGRTAHQGSSVS